MPTNDNDMVQDALTQHFKTIGGRGGSSRSPEKAAAARANLQKARQTRANRAPKAYSAGSPRKSQMLSPMSVKESGGKPPRGGQK